MCCLSCLNVCNLRWHYAPRMVTKITIGQAAGVRGFVCGFVVLLSMLLPMVAMGQRVDSKELEPIANWRRIVALNPMTDKINCDAVIINPSGAFIRVGNIRPDSLLAFGTGFLLDGSQYRFGKLPARPVLRTHDNEFVVIPAEIESAETLLVAFDVKGKNFPLETFDLAGSRETREWLESEECANEEHPTN